MLQKNTFSSLIQWGCCLFLLASCASSPTPPLENQPRDMPVVATSDPTLQGYQRHSPSSESRSLRQVDLSSISTQPYTVQKGDSLWKIARNHHTSIAILKGLNQLQSNILQVGQVLQVPDSSSRN